MAGVSMKAIKSRIKSVENTMQITHAMELVASSKLRRAKEQALITKPVCDILTKTLGDLKSDREAGRSVFFNSDSNGKSCYIVIGGDRGLAGGYNNNLFRAVKKHAANSDFSVLPIGRKSLEHYIARGTDIISSDYEESAETQVSDCYDIGRLICSEFEKGIFGKVYVAYTCFKSILSQEPVIKQLLPVETETQQENVELTIYEPSAESLLGYAASQYVSAFVYCALCEAAASEHAARRNSMNSANKNGAEMLEDMKLQYNRARQSVITQELTEIVAGAEAL